jgi:hypothetical protein
MANLENIPPGEAKQIDEIVMLTRAQLKMRYADKGKPVLRGVHPKDHGCVKAKFKILESLPKELRVGVFAEPRQEFEAVIRFSNAAPTVTPDSPPNPASPTNRTHGSRGMAVKLKGVSGRPLLPMDGPLTQDFLMINQPVFTFANVEDYQALSKVLVEDKDNPKRFFDVQPSGRIRIKDGKPDTSDPTTARVLRTGGIVKRIQSLSTTADPPAFQTPPVSPLDNRYFSGSAFLFGDGRAMKFSANPVASVAGSPANIDDDNYLRTELLKRLTAKGAQDTVFEFQVQVRDADSLVIDTDIEDACVPWDETKFPFVTVATITIPPQDFDSPEQREQCEHLVFSPWHGLVEHQPLGGINRLRRAVYEASALDRRTP